MREIKFRGRSVDKGEWVYGSYIHSIIFGDSYHYIRTTDQTTHKVDPATVGQYTGLKDKNGKEIYEGDIVDYWRTDYVRKWGVVKFGEYEQDGSGGEYGPTNCHGFYVETTKLFPTPIDIEFGDEPYEREEERTVSLAEFELEVIGNRYEHPNLLGGNRPNA